MENITSEEIAWIAGILEGEACFDYHFNKRMGKNFGKPPLKKYPRIRVEMKDEDIILRLYKLLGGKLSSKNGKQINHSKTFLIKWFQPKDVKRILTMIRPWLGKRRGQKVDELFDIFRKQSL